MKILVILTGGTIGSRTEENIIDVNASAAYQLIKLYQERYGMETEFDVVQPFSILSENIEPSRWVALCGCLDKTMRNGYDGVVITHGSDTIPYTAAFIAYHACSAAVPIVLIASNYELQDARSNSLANFYNAVCFVREKKAKGTFVIYQNNKKENVVYLATRLKEADTYLDQFSSYGGVDFGKIVQGSFERNDHPLNPTLQEINLPKKRKISPIKSCDKKILLIHPYPGLDYQNFLLDDSVKAVLHCTYHSATMCSKKERFSAVEFIKRCQEKGIDFYACSLKQEQNLYATSRSILKAGAIPLINISAEAAYAKLIFAYNQEDINPRELMKQNIYYEILPPFNQGSMDNKHKYE